jgi:hypothetical protein
MAKNWLMIFAGMHKAQEDPQVTEAIHLQTAKQGLQRAAVAVTFTFTAAGNQLQSLIIFKGKESTNHGKILKQELKSYPVEAIYATQEKVWMSKCMMFLWVEMIFKPFVATGSPRIAPLLFLDSYKVHMMALVNNAITGLGVEVIIIPPSNSTNHSRIVCITNTRVG